VEDFSGEDYQGFRSGRNYVRGAGEYLVYYRMRNARATIKNQAEFDALAIEWQKDCLRYRDVFFAEREVLRQVGLSKWLDLHYFYPHLIDMVRSVFHDGRLYVVTLKDAISVRMLLERQGVPIAAERVWAEDRISSKLQAMEQIARVGGIRNDEILFIDDNVTHLLPVFEQGYRCILAGWGYHTEEHIQLARDHGLPIATIQEFSGSLI
jgi:phosphoglycolate phosphatase-like HAD superfamily hydrolase